MKLVIFGLTITSSWGNGHATLWRGLCRALARRGHDVVFFERDAPWYAAHRDLTELPGTALHLYADWDSALPAMRRHLAEADVAMVTSYCPDGVAASRLALGSSARLKVFYDLDSPVTLDRVARGDAVEYLPPEGLGGFDLCLSYAGGPTLTALESRLGARRAAPLYGSVDPWAHRPVAPMPAYRSDLSYLGTFAPDRQPALERLFLRPAEASPSRRFFLAGSMYPPDFPWRENVFYVPHLAPADHPAFFCSSRLTLNVTREPMARSGWCPSGRLFEAAACGVPVLTDVWEGVEEFFVPGEEILVARDAADALAAIGAPDERLRAVARRARARALESHTADRRARELESLLEAALPALRTGAAPSKPASPSRAVWGLVPAAGAGSRIQPLAFSKELLPVGSRVTDGAERPRAVSEFLVDRMLAGGCDRICFVIAPGKSDILAYYGGSCGPADVCYVVQPRPAGLCDALFRAAHLVRPDDEVAVGLPDTVWFPEDGFRALGEGRFAFLLFPVEHPELFDAVVTDGDGREAPVLEVQVKKPGASTKWVWGAFRMPGRVFLDLRDLWVERQRADEYVGTLVNEYLRRGGEAVGVRAGESYVDVGTLHGYRHALQMLSRGDDASR